MDWLGKDTLETRKWWSKYRGGVDSKNTNKNYGRISSLQSMVRMGVLTHFLRKKELLGLYSKPASNSSKRKYRLQRPFHSSTI
uniref:Uncharacterized protein n=1 Tax=Lactuca sativa TaxID=4236 RepID=A0A9R1XHW6_LACSA|nr:hypothetical protein LSAT_V11C300109720 [Lactuca sativa]